MATSGMEKTTALNQALRRLAEQYAATAQVVLGDNLTSVVLFGSVARGAGRSEVGR